MLSFEDEDVMPPPPPPPPTRLQIWKRQGEEALPFVPYIPLAIGIGTRSTPWLLTAIFTLLAVKPFRRYIEITNCSFTNSGTEPSMVVK